MPSVKTAPATGMLLAAVLLALTGCASQLRAYFAGSLVQDVALATAKYDDLDLAMQAAPTYLLLLEGLLEKQPDNPRLLIAATQGYTSYGVLVESEDPEHARKLYQRAKTCGLRALAQNKRIAPLLVAPYSQFSQIHQYLKSGDLEKVFWAASSWGAWISLSPDSMAALADLPKVILLMEWVLEQDDTFYYGSAHVFLGMYHAALPPALGGDPEKSRSHFERALEIGQERVLMTYVQMARYYARQVFDQQLYQSLLEKALTLPVDRIPELTLQNVVARALAEKLLEETDEFF